MRLSQDELFERQLGDKPLVSPVLSSMVKGCVIDLHLGCRFTPHEYQRITIGRENNIFHSDNKAPFNNSTEYTYNTWVLKPGGFVLGCTKEEINVPDDLVGLLDGRSTLARLGITVHATAHRIDPGFKGVVVLEISNVGNMVVTLTAGMGIAAIGFEQLTSRVNTTDGNLISKYQGQSGATGAKFNF